MFLRQSIRCSNVERLFSKQILSASRFIVYVFLVLRKKVLRGAVTNGHQWIFILIKINDNYEGASFMDSDIIQIGGPIMNIFGQGMSNMSWPDLIAAILLHWVHFFQWI
jgi:hypothetical protein